MGRSGLVQKKITTKGKHGPVIRSYWVKASPKAEAKKGNRRMGAGEYLKAHGLQLAGRSAAVGVASGVGTIAGHHAGMRAGVKISNSYAGAAVGAHLGGTIGGFLAGHHAGKAAYRDKRGQQIIQDFRRGTAGAKVAHIAVALGSSWGAQSATLRAHNYALNRRYR